MKKSLSFLVAVALVFGLFASMASAADAGLTTEQKYQQFVDQKILKGDPSGDARLSANLTRAEFVTIADAINGLAEVTTTQTFSDVTKGQWFHGAIEAAAKAGLVNGIGQGKFGPKLNVTVEQAIKVFVISAGLKPVDGATVDGASAWAAPYIKAAQDAGFPVPANFKADATRGQAIDLAYAATVAKAVPTLSDVKAVANTDDTITVTGKVVGTADSVKVTLGTAEAVAATLNADGTFSYTTPKQTAGTYTISVVAYDGTKASAAATQSVTIDSFQVSSVTVLGSNQIAVKFNKPVLVGSTTVGGGDNPANYALTVGGTAQAITSVAISDDKLTATLTLTNPFTNDTYGVFEVKNTLTTAAGATVAAYKNSIYLNDTTAPTVTGYTFTGTTAKFTFSEALASVGTISVDGIQIYNTGSAAIQYSFTAGNNYVTISGWDKGTTHQVDFVGFADRASDANVGDYSAAVAVPNDTTPPAVSSVTVANGKVTIKFSEALKLQTTSTPNFYADVQFNNGTVVPVTAIDDDNQAVVDLSTAFSSNFVTGTLKVTSYKDYADLSGADFSQTITLTKDTTAAAFQGISYSGSDIILKFSEDVQPVTTLADVASGATVSYTDNNGVLHTNVADDATVVVTGAEIGLDTNNDGTLENNYVILHTNNEAGITNSVVNALAAGSYKVTLPTGLVDDGVNDTANVSTTFTVTGGTSKGTLQLVDATVAANTATTQIVFTFNANLTKSQLVPSNFLIGGNPLPAGTTLYFVTSRNVVYADLPSGSISLTGARTVSVRNLVDENGNTLNSSYTSIPGVSLVENVAPKLVSATVTDAETVTLTFSENLQAQAAVTGIEVWVNNAKVTVSGAVATGTDNVVTVTVPTNTFALGQTVVVKTVSSNVLDINNNKAADSSVTAK